jgi:hypothetical protein
LLSPVMGEGLGGGEASAGSPHPNLPLRWGEGDLRSPHLPQSATRAERAETLAGHAVSSRADAYMRTAENLSPVRLSFAGQYATVLYGTVGSVA